MLKIDHDEPYDEHYISDILKTVKTIAMVGAVSYTHLTLPTKA